MANSGSMRVNMLFTVSVKALVVICYEVSISLSKYIHILYTISIQTGFQIFSMMSKYFILPLLVPANHQHCLLTDWETVDL